MAADHTLDDMQAILKKYVLPAGLSVAAFGVLIVLKRLGIIYQLFHKVIFIRPMYSSVQREVDNLQHVNLCMLALQASN